MQTVIEKIVVYRIYFIIFTRAIEKRMNLENREMKHDNMPTKRNGDPIKLNDIGFRLILIPFFGIVIPIVTGLVDHSRYVLWQTKLSYLYTIGIAFIIWHGNRFLLFTLRSYFDWFNKPIKENSCPYSCDFILHHSSKRANACQAGIISLKKEK